MGLVAWLVLAMLAGIALAGPAVEPDGLERPQKTSGPPPGPPALLPTPQFRRYGAADGLPNALVYGIAQDRHGLMWFATDDGVARYDGVEFKVYRAVAGDASSLPSSENYLLYVDLQGRLWIGGVASGLSLYLEAGDRFRSWQHDPRDPHSLAHNEIWAVAQTRDGQLWVATSAGLDRMRADGNGFDHIVLPPSGDDAQSELRGLWADDSGRLWIATRHGLYVRDSGGRIRPLPVEPGFDLRRHEVWHIDGDGGTVRIATDDRLLEVGADGVARPVGLPQPADQRISGSLRDRHGRLWIGATDGLRLDLGQGRPLLHFDRQSFMPGGIPDGMVWQIVEDREGGLWVALGESGVAYLPPRWDRLSFYKKNPEMPGGLAGTIPTMISSAGDGKLWVGGNGWVDKLDPRTGLAEHILYDLPSSANSVAKDRLGRLWFSFDSTTLYLYDHGRFTRLGRDWTGIVQSSYLQSTTDGRLYVASWQHGLYEMDLAALRGHAVPMHEPSDDARLPNQLLMVGGELWYVCHAGLMRLGPDRQLAYVQGAPRVSIAAVALDRDGRGLWLQRDGAQLEHYRVLRQRLSLDRRVQAPSSFWATLGVHNLQVDAAGQLWLFAVSGLWRFDPASGRFFAYGRKDGLADIQIADWGGAVLAGDTMYAAVRNGVLGFHPRQLAFENEPALPPQIVLYRAGPEKDGEGTSLEDGRTALALGWRDRDLRVRARVASYVNPADNRYQFRLDGFDADWVDVGQHGEREFAGLAPGRYTLEVRGAGPSGSWSYAPPLVIDVDAPPWARWWAWLIYLMLAAWLGWLALHYWRRRLLRQQEIQQAAQSSRAKSQFLAMLGHEIRTPMTGVMGMAELLLSTPLSPLQREYATTMQRSGGLLLKLVNDALDLARIEAGRLELESGVFDPAELLREVARLDSGLALAKGIALDVQIGADVPAWVRGDAERVKQVLLNLANNALKFTERGRVILGLQTARGGLRYSVSDTGPGISEAGQARLFQRFEQIDSPQRKAGSGLGLAICRELVVAMGGHIELASQLGQGSAFHVELPLPAAEPPVEPSRPAPSARTQRLLLVEDDTTVAAVIVGLLHAQGHAVRHVVNGLAALAELAHRPADAVLLDLDLPGIDGFQIARLLRQQESENGRHLPIIAVTARSGGDEEVRAREAGMDGFLRKPVSGDQLAAALAEFARAPQDA